MPALPKGNTRLVGSKHQSGAAVFVAKYPKPAPHGPVDPSAHLPKTSVLSPALKSKQPAVGLKHQE